jgi:DNA-binding transcriptional ArsR family regulator
MDETQVKIALVAELAYRAGLDHCTLVTRPIGRRFLPILESLVQDLADSNAVILDFGEIDIMDASFADEVFSTLAVRRSRRIHRGRCIILEALEGASLENLDMALSSRTVRETGLRNCVFPVHSRQYGTKLAGKSEGHVQTSFELLTQHRQLTARTLADTLDLDIAAASTRLKVLFDLGLATRAEERDGQVKQFVYTWPL